MEKELKQVQEIYPEAEFRNSRKLCIEFNNFHIDLFDGFLLGYNGNKIAGSKNFNKILGVLKATKLCEED